MGAGLCRATLVEACLTQYPRHGGKEVWRPWWRHGGMAAMMVARVMFMLMRHPKDQVRTRSMVEQARVELQPDRVEGRRSLNQNP